MFGEGDSLITSPRGSILPRAETTSTSVLLAEEGLAKVPVDAVELADDVEAVSGRLLFVDLTP
jgi:hypothetical protein